MPKYEQIFLGRQPILDREESIYGYELLFRASADATVAEFPDQDVASASVIVDAFANMGSDAVLGRHEGFINVSRDLLLDDVLEALPRERVVLELLEDIEPRADVVARCRELRKAGFRLALDDYVPGDPRACMLPLVDLVKVDIMGLTPARIAKLVAVLRPTGCTLLAEKVETREERDVCAGLGFELFQGFYFARPTTLNGTRVTPDGAELLGIVRDLTSGIENGQIEERFKRHVDLGLNLLRIVNSAGRGGRYRIQSVGHALVYLGREPLRRWLLLLLYACGGKDTATKPLLNLAAVRGRMLELLDRGEGEFAPGSPSDAGFLAGMLSLAGPLLGREIPDLLEELNIDEPIREAILERSGKLGALLDIVESLERGEFATLAERLGERGISTEDLVAAQSSAYGWAHDLERSLSEPEPTQGR